MAGMRLDRLSRFGSLGIPASTLILNLRRKKQDSKASRAPPGMEVPRSRQELAAANSGASTGASERKRGEGGEGESAGRAAGRVLAGGAAVEKALGSFDFDFAQPQSLLFTRKGGRLPYPVPVDRRANDLFDRGNVRGRGRGKALG